jgi:hypothetical protein
VDWVCDEEAVESRLSDEYAVRLLPDRVNKIHKWGLSQYGPSRDRIRNTICERSKKCCRPRVHIP